MLNRVQGAMENFMDAISDMGRCLWPHGEKSRQKANCANALEKRLRQRKGEPGMLLTALAFTGMSMKSIDELLQFKHYGNVFSRKFGLKVPYSLKLMENIQKANQGAVGEKHMACWNVVASLGAIERTIAKAAIGLKVWFQTYGRKRTKISIYGNWRPCKFVFHKLGQAKDGDICKSTDWTHPRYNMQNEESLACSSKLNVPDWYCSQGRNWKHDDMWCSNVGTYQGSEYKNDPSKRECGCTCCTREAVSNSLWPEMGHH